MTIAAARCQRFADELARPYGLERSIKLTPRGVRDQRFLMTWHRQALAGPATDTFLDLCARLEMPDALRSKLASRLAAKGGADLVHLGVEGDEQGEVCKVYLEYAANVKRQLTRRPNGAAGSPLLAHVAYKWRLPHSSEGTVARYRLHPGLSWADLRGRSLSCFNANSPQPFTEAVARLLDRLSAEHDVAATRFMLVEEDGNGRHSFDLNLYDCAIQVGAVAAMFADVGSVLALDRDSLERTLADMHDSTLGHIAGGMDRSGQPFLTLYHGVEAGR